MVEYGSRTCMKWAAFDKGLSVLEWGWSEGKKATKAHVGSEI